MRIRKIAVLALAFCLGLLPVSVSAGQASSIGKGVLHVLGMGFLAEPEHQTAPVNMGTAVNTRLFTPDYDGVESAIPPEMTNGLTVVADLSGPGISTPHKIESAPGEQLVIPPLPQEGTYVLDNIRLMRGEQVVMYASPSMARIDTIKKLLITQVTSRALSIDEIEKLGISVTSDNFTAYKFTVGFGTETGTVNMEIPVVMQFSETAKNSPTTLAPPEMPDADIKPAPSLNAPNLVVEPVIFKPAPREDIYGQKLGLPVAGVIVIPGNISFLNQFFEVMLLVSNNAPSGSTLSLSDISAEIVLAAGNDNIPDSPDDPLRIAKTGSGVGSGIVPVLNAAGGAKSVGPQESGEGRFLVEGLREGTHTIDIKITGTLVGLPNGPVAVTGTAKGTVIVRNPNFTLVFGQPDVVRDGEEYSLFVTVNNTSEVAANLVQLALPPDAVYGATIVGDSDPATPVGTVGIRTIPAGDSAVAEFRLIARKTGQVTSTAYTGDDGTKGVFRLRTGVDERGVPLSPDTVVLSKWSRELSPDLLYHAMRVLGLAHSAATAPVLPKGVPRIPKQNVTKRAWELIEAGLRVKMGESLEKSAADLVIGWLGSGFRDKGFEQILRTTDAGRSFLFEAGKILAGSGDLLAAQRAFGDTVKYRGPFVSAAIENTGDAIAYMEMTDAGGLSLGRRAGGSAVRDIPYGVLIDMDGDSAAASGEMALVDADEGNAYDLKITGIQTGEINFGLIQPVEGGGFVHAEYRNVYVRAGEIVTGRIVAGGAVPVLMLGPQETGPTGTYAYEYPAGPRAVAAMQLSEADTDGLGRVVAVLFDEKIDTTNAKKPENYGIDYRSGDRKLLNDPKAVQVMPSGRIVEVMFDSAISPFFEYDIKIAGVTDPDGNPQEPLSARLPVTTTLTTPGGIVSGTVRKANGDPVANALVVVRAYVGDGSNLLFVPIERTLTDEEGRYRLDFVPLSDAFEVETADPATGQTGGISARLHMDRQQMQLDILLLGLGAVSGRVVMSDNATPVADALVELQSLTSPGTLITKTDASGRFSVEGVAVGDVNLRAARKEYRGAVGVNIAKDGDAVEVLLPVYSMLGETGALKGRVFASDGKTPLAGVPVIVSGAYFQDWRRTDSSGNYLFEHVPQRELSIYSFRQETGETARITVTVEGVETKTVDIVFPGAARLTGTVYDHTGAPIAGASVVAGVTLVKSDENGNFVIEAVPAGRVDVQAQRPNDRTYIERVSVFIGAPGETASVAITFPDPRRTGTIRGYAKDVNGKPLPRQEVCVFRDEVYLQCVYTDNAGFYTAEVPLDSYSVYIVNSSGTDADKKLVKLAVPGQVIDLADLRFKGFGTVTGTIFQPDGQSPTVASIIFTRTLFTAFGSPYPKEERYISNQLTADGLSGKYTIEKVHVGDEFRLEASNAFYAEPVVKTGKVRNPDDVVPIDIVMQPTSVVRGQVFLANGDRAGAGVVLSLKTPTIAEMQVKTADDGTYRFDLVPPSTFILDACDPVTGNYGTATGSVATGDEAVIDMKILGRGMVTVNVIDGSGNPVRDARVRLDSGSSVAHLTGEFPVFTTGQTGIVKYQGVPEGGFSVTAEHPGTLTGGKTGGAIPEDNTEIAVTVVLSASGTVSGAIITADGAATVPFARVKLTTHGMPPYFATSDAQGRYMFDYVPLGAFQVEVFHPATGRVGLAKGAVDYDTQKVNLDPRLLALGTVEGCVRMSTGEPVAAGTVTIVSKTVSNSGAIVMTSNMEGRFKAYGIPEGEYTVTVRHPFWNLWGETYGRIRLEGELARTDISFEPTGTISGRTLASDGITPVPYAEIEIGGGNYAILTYDFVRNVYNRTTVRTVSGADGSFVFDTVPLGEYTLKAREQEGEDGGSLRVKVQSPGSVISADIVFVGTGNIIGRVVNAAGTLPGRQVTLSLNVTGPLANSYTAFTDMEGNFAFYDIPAGDVTISANIPGSRLGGIYNGVLAGDGGTIENVLIPIEPSGSISGTVLREDGVTPVKDALVSCSLVRTDGKSSVTIYALTGNAGGFAIDVVPLGTFRIYVNDYSSEGVGAAAGSITGETGSVTLVPIVLDEHHPSVVAITPRAGSVQVPLVSAITIEFSEPVDAATINGSHIRVATDSSGIAGTFALDAGRRRVTFTPSNPWPEFRPVTVAASGVRDDMGKSMTETFIATFVTADVTPPSIISARLIKGAFVVEFSEPVEESPGALSVTDSAAGAAVQGVLTFSARNMVASFYPLNPLPDGKSYRLDITGCTDAYGNRAADYATTFQTGDKTAPVISLALSSTVAIEGVPVTVTATPQASADLFVVDFSVNGQRVKSVNRPPYKIDISPTETITVSATPMDYAGNMGQAASTTISVVPNNPPVAAILAPQTGTAIGTGQAIGVRVEASDDLGLKEIEMRVRSTGISDTVVHAVGTGALSAERFFTVSVPASSKSGMEISVEVVARDMRGVESAPARLLLHTIDKTPPSIEITSFKTGFNVSPGDSIPVNVFVSDNETVSSIEFRTEGGLQLSATALPDAPASDAIGKFTLTVPGNYAGGTKIIVAPYAVDAAGNIGRARPVTLTVDDVAPPTVAIASPATGSSVIARDTVTVRVRAADNDAVDRVEFFLNGKIFATDRYESGGYYETTFIAQAEPGSIELSAKAFDKSGKSAEAASVMLNVAKDSIAPTVGITSSLSAIKFAEGHKVSISASFSDNIGISSVEFLSGGTVVAKILKPTRNDASFDYTIPAIISDGPVSATTTLEVRATDLDGNIGTTGALPITVIRDNPPTVSILSPSEGQGVLGGARISIRAELKDDFGVNSWTLKVNGAKVSEGTGSSVSASYDVPSTAPGSTLAVEIAAVDSMGKSTTASIGLNVPVVVTPDAAYSAGTDIVDAIPSGGYVYVLEKGFGISVIDMRNASGPTRLGGLQLAGDLSGIRAFEKTVYVYGVSGIALISASDPHNPAMIGHIDTPSPVSGMAFGNGHAYAAMGAAGLMMLDVHDPASAYGLTVKLPKVAGVDVEGDTLYIAHNTASSSLDAYSIATPFSPVLRATASTGSVRLFDAAHNFGVGLAGAGTLESFTHNPASGFENIYSLTPNGAASIRAVDVIDGFVLHASGQSGWGMAGVSNNGMLSDMGMVRSGANVASVFMQGGYIYSAEGVAGLKSYRITVPTLPLPTVSIVQPLDGASLEEGAAVEVVAEVANGNSAVVTFFIDGSEVFADKTSPYSYRFRVQHNITGIDLQAKAENLNGASALSGIVHLNVANETVPPSIALVSPPGTDTPLAMYEGETLRVEGAVTDKYGIEKVELFIDGVLVAASRFAEFAFGYPFSDDGIENTDYTLNVLIRATDLSGNSADRQFTVQVVEDNPPQISISSPLPGSVAYSGMTITIVASASDDRNVQSVKFFVGDVLLGTGTASGANSYSVAYRVPDVGEDTQETITTVVTDSVGQTASASVAITFRLAGIGVIASVGSNAEAVDVFGNVAVTGGGNGLISIYDISVPVSPKLVSTLNTGYAIRQVRIIGNIAYVTEDGWRTWIVDISDPAHPVSLSSISSGSHFSVDVYDGLAFMGAYYNIHVYDVKNARKPVWIASKSLQGYVYDVQVDRVAGRLYAVADNGASSYLYVLDVRNLSNIVEMGRVALSGRPKRMEVTDGLVYITTNSGLVIVDIANPSSPGIIANSQLPGVSIGISVAGKQAIVSGGEAVGISLLDVSASTQPVYVASIDTPGAAKDISVSHGLVYVADGAKGLTVVSAGNLPPVVHRDRITLSGLKPDGTVDVTGLPWAVEDESPFVDIRLANAANGIASTSRVASGATFTLNIAAAYGDTLILEAAESEDPFQKSGPVSLGRVPVGEVSGSVVMSNGVQAVDASGGLAVTGDKNGNVRVFDVSDTANPVQLGTLNTGYAIRQVRIIGNTAYVAEDGWRTWIVDISDPAHPVSLSSISSGSHYSVDTHDGLAFVGSYYGVYVYDVRDADKPVRIASKSMQGYVNDVHVDGVAGRLYAVTDNGASSYLYVLDVRNLSNIVEIGRVKVNGNAQRFELTGGKAFIAAKTGMAIVSLERLGTSAFGADGNVDGVADDVLSFTPSTGVAYDVAVQNGYAYVTDGLYNGIRVMDVSDPSAPVEIGFIRTGGEPMDMDMNGAAIFVGDSRGLSVAGTYLGAVPVLDMHLIGMTVSPDASTVTVTGSTGAVSDDVYPVIVHIQSGISGLVYETTVAAPDNGAFSMSLPFIANDSLSISLHESTPNPATAGPFELGSIPVVPTLNLGLVRMEVVPSTASVAVIGASGAVTDDVYPVMVKIQSGMSGQFYTTSVASSDKGAFRINAPWLLGDRFYLTLQESTKNPVTVGPIDLGPIPVVPALNTPFVRIQVDPSTSNVSVIGSAGAVTDDVYPVIVKVASGISGQSYATTVASSDNGAFSVSLPWLLADRLSITLQESTPNPVTIGPIDLGSIPVVPALDTSLIKIQVDPSTSSVSVIGSAGAVTDDVYPITVTVQSGRTGYFYVTSVAVADNGAFSVSLPWLSSDDISISAQESTPYYPVTVGPVALGKAAALPLANIVRRVVSGSPVQTFDISGGLAVSGDLAGHLKTYDVSNPANPVALGDLATGYPIKRVRLIDNVAYVVYDQRYGVSFDVVDLSDPAHPAIVVMAWDSFGIGSYCVDGIDDYAFSPPNEYFTDERYAVQVSGGSGTLTMYLSDPKLDMVFPGWALRNMAKMYPAWYLHGIWDKFLDIAVDRNSRYLFAMTDSKLLVLDPFGGNILSEWGEIGLIDLGSLGHASRLKLTDGHACVVTNNGVGIVSLARLGSPGFGSDSDGDGKPDDIIGSHETRGPAYDMAIANGMAYVTDKDNGGITVIDISNPAKPAELGVIKLDGEPLTVKAVGSMLYVGDSKGVSVIETDNR